MKQNWRQVLLPRRAAGALCAVYMLTYLLDLYIIRLGIPVPKEVGTIRMHLLVLASGLYGYHRVRAFHPFYSGKYLEWLCLTPWSIEKPLPKGPIHLIWVDLIIVGVLTVLAYSNFASAVPVPAIVFLGVYIVMMCITFEGEELAFAAVLVFLAPFAVYPHANRYGAVLVLVALYMICWAGLWRFLRSFPWNTKYWKADPVKELQEQAMRQRVIGWPFRHLSAYEVGGISVFRSFLLSLLVTWWVHVIRCAVAEPYDFFWLRILAILVAGARTIEYAGIYRPPISLLGRIFTGRLIIPRYDKIYVAPICILLAGTLLPFALDRLGLEPLWNFELCFFLIFFLALALPPTLKEWQLTGAYRLGRHAQAVRPKPPSPQDEALSAFFSARLKS